MPDRGTWAVASIAHHDAPLIGQRAAMEGGDDHAREPNSIPPIGVFGPCVYVALRNLYVATTSAICRWISVARRCCAFRASIAAHDAPLIGERAAMRGHVATEGGDERGGGEGRSFVRSPASRTAAAADATRAARSSMTHATRELRATEGGDQRAGVRRARFVRAPASRTGSNGGKLDALAATRPTEARMPSARGDWMSVSRPHAPAFAAGNDAPPIGERAATVETAGNDAIRAAHARQYNRLLALATMRRSSANARQTRGAHRNRRWRWAAQGTQQHTANRCFRACVSATLCSREVLNETMARFYFGKRDPLGKYLLNGGDRYTVIGVVKDMKERSLKSKTERRFYGPLFQSDDTFKTLNFEVRDLVRKRRKAPARHNSRQRE